MVAKRGRKPTGKPRVTRASASLPPEIYSNLQVIRDAAEKNISDRWPLFATKAS
jgi:hypothetical protein